MVSRSGPKKIRRNWIFYTVEFSGWLPSYRCVLTIIIVMSDREYWHFLNLSSISAILMQIRLAISNLEPRPARLASNWNQYVDIHIFQMSLYSLIRPYDVAESLVGYKRAAATHNWTIPEGLDRLVRWTISLLLSVSTFIKQSDDPWLFAHDYTIIKASLESFRQAMSIKKSMRVLRVDLM